MRLLRRLIVCVVSAIPLPSQAADPVLMLLMTVAKEVIASAARQKQSPAVIAAPLRVPDERYPGTTVEPRHLRQLIDECFAYLSAAQRAEIFDSLHAALIDPRNAAARGNLIDYFASRALAVREAQRRLAHLSATDRDQLLAEFRVAVAAMPEDEAAQIGELLRQRVLPVPGDLNAQLLAALDSRP